MPRGDGTGPAGAGPMTGRGLGYCAGYQSPGFTKGAPRGGGGFGRGRGYARFARTPARTYATRPAYGWRTPAPASAPAATTQQATGAPAGYSAPQQAGPENELEALRQQAQALENQLENIRSRMEELQDQQE